jgi:predicted ATPase
VRRTGPPEPTAAEAKPAAIAPPGFAAPLADRRIVGRSAVLESFLLEAGRRRLVTIAGPGGIGKTTLALAALDQLRSAYPDGIHFLDLATIGDAKQITSAVAANVGLAVRSENPLPALISFLKERRVLLVLDSCEHVVDAAAELCDALIGGTSALRLIATSREPLRVEGERVIRLPPLAVPESLAGLTASDALQFPAVQLFVERAAARLDSFEFHDAIAPTVAGICVKLDGIPLALELAAGRVDAFGVNEIAERINDRFALLTRGKRTALLRHQTLQSTLDWSYDLLSEIEGLTLRRLAVFSGWFTAESAVAIMADALPRSSEVVEIVADLVAKSLLIADTAGQVTFYRLLNSTRDYAFRKLEELGEVKDVLASHARHFCEMFGRAQANWETQNTAEWLATYSRHLDNLRAALDWAFRDEADAGTAIALTVAAVPLWFELSLMEECRSRVERALELQLKAKLGERWTMQLYSARAWSQMYTTAASTHSDEAWALALKLARDLDDRDYQLRGLWGLWAGRMNAGEFGAAYALAEEFAALAASDPDGADLPIADRLTGAALHFLGNQNGARVRIERMLARYLRPERRSHIVRFQFDQRITAHITLERILWLQGYADQAMRDVHANIERALVLNHTLSLCNALAQAACPLALMSGHLDQAQRYTSLLLEQTTRNDLDVWHAYGCCFQGAILIRRDEVDDGLRLLEGGVDKLRQAKFVQYMTAFLGILAESMANAGRNGEAAPVIAEALERAARTDERWFTPELMRIQGTVAQMNEAKGRAEAETCFRASLALAREQEALAWELRTAVSLHRLQLETGGSDGRVLLESCLARCSEGHDTADLKAAQALLGQGR